MVSIHGLKRKKKNINLMLKRCHASKHDLQRQIEQLEVARCNVDALILSKKKNNKRK